LEKPIAGAAPQDKESPMSDQVIKLSVLKGLWFPMITNLTNLLLDRSVDNQKKALRTLFAVLEKATLKMPLKFWREVFS
jgi:hypothetical protein